ncbi:MAG: glycosyltransferase family 39 protein [Cyanobacteria bacterium]|nr:glycosyltransferase family 39 protein [Cyanobacteriota bacterium]
MRVLVFAAALYLLTPGHPDILLSGVPLGQTGAFLLITVLLAWAWTRHVAVRVPPSLIRLLGVAIAVKFAIALTVPHTGWLAAYYANDQLKPPVRRSLDFQIPGATRIDRQLSFVDTQFPVHFYNEQGFNFGLRREATEPFSVLWRGYVEPDEPLRLAAEARGPLEVSVDGVTIEGPPTIAPGKHVIEVRYRKAKEIEGAAHVRPLDAGGQPRPWAIGEVTPHEVPKSQRTVARWLAPVGWLAHAVALVAFVLGAWPVLSARAREIASLPIIEKAHHYVAPVVILGLSLQGLWKTRHLVGNVWSLTGGDDWLAFEMQARDAMLNGWMMQSDVARGLGEPFIVYPGYSYFLVGVHWLTGESMAGAILANFVMLALATVLVHATAVRFTSKLGALIAVAWLLALQQMDFVRYYTVTLLSENLYFVLVALTIYALVRFCARGSMAWIVCGGLAAGAAAATRPTMMLFMPIAAIVAALAMFTARRYMRALVAPALLAICFMMAIAPITYRNYVMSRKIVLVTEGQAPTFINYNLPTSDPEANLKYVQAFRGSNSSAARILLQILLDHPGETLRNWGIKAGFGLGMVHWMGSGTPHPELALTSLFYLVALVFVRSARTLPALLVHGFILTHLVTLLLTMPSNYGYRMVLSMYILMVIFAGALVAQFLERRSWSRASTVAPA